MFADAVQLTFLSQMLFVDEHVFLFPLLVPGAQVIESLVDLLPKRFQSMLRRTARFFSHQQSLGRKIILSQCHATTVAQKSLANQPAHRRPESPHH